MPDSWESMRREPSPASRLMLRGCAGSRTRAAGLRPLGGHPAPTPVWPARKSRTRRCIWSRAGRAWRPGQSPLDVPPSGIEPLAPMAVARASLRVFRPGLTRTCARRRISRPGAGMVRRDNSVPSKSAAVKMARRLDTSRHSRWRCVPGRRFQTGARLPLALTAGSTGGDSYCVPASRTLVRHPLTVKGIRRDIWPGADLDLRTGGRRPDD